MDLKGLIIRDDLEEKSQLQATHHKNTGTRDEVRVCVDEHSPWSQVSQETGTHPPRTAAGMFRTCTSIYMYIILRFTLHQYICTVQLLFCKIGPFFKLGLHPGE